MIVLHVALPLGRGQAADGWTWASIIPLWQAKDIIPLRALRQESRDAEPAGVWLVTASG